MARSDDIKQKIVDPALAGGDLGRMEQATKVWQAAAEAEKTELESENSRKQAHSESLRFWIPILTSSVGAVALVLTLIFQISASKENSELQRATNEGIELRDLIKNAAMPPTLQAMASTTRLKTFLSSPPAYTSEARDLAVMFLSNIGDPVEFKFLFKKLDESTDETNFPDLMRLSFMLNTNWGHANDQLKEKKAEEEAMKKAMATAPSAPPNKPGKSSPNLPPGAGFAMAGQFPPRYPYPPQGRRDAGMSMQEMSADELQQMMDATTSEITEVGDAIVRHLQKSVSANTADLSDACLLSNDLSGLNLNAANLAGLDIEFTTVKDVDLGTVSQFDGSIWTGTPWWRAKALSPALIEYLKQNYPYDPKQQSYPDKSTAVDYTTELARLAAASPTTKP